MRVLAIEPYFGGSHRAFLEGWASRSRHHFTVHHLPAQHWKWRMRLGAAEIADALIASLDEASEGFDLVWCSSMLDVALWRSLVPARIAALPHVLYFHENQFAYPDAANPTGQASADPRDLHFGLTQVASALATLAAGPSPWQPGDAPRLWWNSSYNRETFAVGAGDLFTKNPERDAQRHVGWLPRLAQASCVQPPGVEPITGRRRKAFGSPPHLIWAARWEHDKQPEVFFRALERLAQRGVDFRLSVLGQRFQLVPAVFERAREYFADRVVHWGFLPDRESYARALAEADVFVCTASHEFFGLAAVEAATAGCTLLLPGALAYPEVFGPAAHYFPPSKHPEPAPRLHETAEALANALMETLAGPPRHAGLHCQKYGWNQRVPALDEALDAVARSRTDP